MMKRHQLDITVSLVSPFLFPILDAAPFGIDRAALRDRQKRPIIPADQVRGVLRHAAEQVNAEVKLWSPDLVIRLFGKPDDEGKFALNRSQIVFGDLVAERVPQASALAYRVKIDDETGAAEAGHLLAVELVAPHGQEVTFSGSATLFAPDHEKDKIVNLLDVAAGRVSAIGAMKSAGFGEVFEKVEGQEVTSSFRVRPQGQGTPLLSATPRNPIADRVHLVIGIDRPFLIDPEIPAPNVYLGATVIPGGAIKGALARKFELAGQARPDLQAALTALSISHASPVCWPDRTLPLSVVANDNGVADALGHQAVLIGDQPAFFQNDMKPRHLTAARTAAGLSDLPSFAQADRGHARILPGRGTAAEGQLFFTRAVDPGNCRWQCVVDYGNVGDAKRGELHSALMSGIDGLGATGARLTFADETISAPPEAQPRPNQDVDITLETDAIMAIPEDGDDAHKAYEAYFRHWMGSSTILIDFFAQQGFARGYHGRRFRREDERYRPFVLTRAGSIFRLRGYDPGALDKALRYGLPAPFVGKKQTTWQDCPFQPENGYGRIRADWQGVGGLQA